MDSAEDELEGARLVRDTDLRKEAPLAFSEYRNYNRIQLTVQRGWDQYLPEASAAQSSVPVIGAGVAGVAVTSGQEEHPAATGFFARRPATAATAVQTAQVGLNEVPGP